MMQTRWNLALGTIGSNLRLGTAMLLGLAIVTGCAGRNSLPSTPSGNTAPTLKSGILHFSVKIPKRFKTKVEKYRTTMKRDSSGRLVARPVLTMRPDKIGGQPVEKPEFTPEYVSASTVSLYFYLADVNGSSTTPANYTRTLIENIQSSSNCTDNAGTYTCNEEWTLPAASDTIAVYACDVTSCASGNILSWNSETYSIVAGTQTVGMTLYGQTASIQLLPGNTTYETGSQASGFTVLGSATNAWPFYTYPLDADGNRIIGPGAPTMSVKLTSGYFALSAITGNYSFTATPPNSNSTVTDTLTATATYPAGYSAWCVGSCTASTTIATILPKTLLSTRSNSPIVSVFSPQAVAEALGGATNVALSGTLDTTGLVSGKILFDSSGDAWIPGGPDLDYFTAAQIASAANGAGLVAPKGSTTCQGSGHNIISEAMLANGTLWVAEDSTNPEVCGFSTTAVSQAEGGASAVSATATLAVAATIAQDLIDISNGPNNSLYVLEDYGGGNSEIQNWKTGALSNALTNGSTGVASTGTLSTGTSGLISGFTRSLVYTANGLISQASTSGGKVAIEAFDASLLPTAGSGTSPTAETGSGGSGSVAGVAYDPSGNLYVSNDAATVWVFTASQVTALFSGTNSQLRTGILGSTNTYPAYQVATDPTTGSVFTGSGTSAIYTYYGPGTVTEALAGTTQATPEGSLNDVGTALDLKSSPT